MKNENDYQEELVLGDISNNDKKKLENEAETLFNQEQHDNLSDYEITLSDSEESDDLYLNKDQEEIDQLIKEASLLFDNEIYHDLSNECISLYHFKS